MKRRQLLAYLGGGALIACPFVRPASAQARPKIVIIGGGAAGILTAKQLAYENKDTLDIVLIAPQKIYETCSNLPLLGLRTAEHLTHNYDLLDGLSGLTVVHERAILLERDKKRVLLASNTWISYDRLVLATGLDLDYTALNGWSAQVASFLPHGWKGVEQVSLLQRQMQALPDNAVVTILVPDGAIRAPHAPYERAGLMAQALHRMGKTGVKILILDAKTIMPQRDLFLHGWLQHTPRMIEWHPPALHGGILGVDAADMTVKTGQGDIKAALINVIPRQKVGELAVQAKLTDASLYCPVDPFTLKSKHDAAIYIVGDAAHLAMPKTAASARAQASVVAMQLRGELTGARTLVARFEEKTWAFLAQNDALYDAGSYQPFEDTVHLVASSAATLRDSSDQRALNAQNALADFDALEQDIFG